MMYWKNVTTSDALPQYISAMWKREQELPKIFRHASRLWTPTFEAFTAWVRTQAEIWALFQEDRLMSCIFIEKQENPRMAIIHFNTIEHVDPAVFIAKCSELRDMLFHRGVKYIRGWTLKKNFVLRQLMAAIGFKPTGFRMDQGASHGRPLRWEIFQIKAI